MSKKNSEQARAARLVVLIESLSAETEQAKARHNAAQAALRPEPPAPSKADQVKRLAKAANEDAMVHGGRVAAVQAAIDTEQAEYADALDSHRARLAEAESAATALAVVQSRLDIARADLNAEVREQAAALQSAALERYKAALAELVASRCEVNAILAVAMGKATAGGFRVFQPSYGQTEFANGLKVAKDTSGESVEVTSDQTAAMATERSRTILAGILAGSF